MTKIFIKNISDGNVHVRIMGEKTDLKPNEVKEITEDEAQIVVMYGNILAITDASNETKPKTSKKAEAL
jgi:hypothetical protein|nr:MAG TPA: hypothetical protein [Caudoviricetes sp.]